MTPRVEIPRLRLNDGRYMPAVGIGCWMGRVGEGEHVVRMVKTALGLGYRHIDTASNYGNEASVGRAIRESGVPREEIFLTTKLASKDHGRVAAALDRSLEKLGVEYVDLFLMHWPQTLLQNGEALQPNESPTLVETWHAMEDLLSSGKTRSIGVSNFSIKTLTTLLLHALIVPTVNQVEAHPCLPQHALLAFCESKGIRVTAYSPLGRNKYAGEDVDVVRIARQRGVSPPCVLLSWGVQRGTTVVPKSEDKRRMKENIEIISLTEEEMRVLDRMHEKPGMHRSVCVFHSEALGGSCFGWTYKQLGWDMGVGGVVRAGSE
ncbi:D-galacturonate reductase [Hypsizygus marmoreus]|uniref:D-galacturonate reductase n=1 Tax=Hypsizygus marmoreus TaxID=39966 RepID=A0A369K1W0_HYPMA|nr:D-galacturonate reductase [Hypsizygus marmoreus]